MTLVNQGTIVATGDSALIIDTGTNVVTNSSTLEATGSGGLVIESGVDNSGSLWANGGDVTLHGDLTGAGTATISGTATLEFGAASDQNVTFADGGNGTLKLDVLVGFTGSVSGFVAGNPGGFFSVPVDEIRSFFALIVLPLTLRRQPSLPTRGEGEDRGSRTRPVTGVKGSDW